MTSSSLDDILSRINNEDSQETLFKKQIGKNVYYAKHWPNLPSIQDGRREEGSNTVYLILSPEKKYIGIVLDMRIDLHWYIQENHRGKGYLVSALQSSIIPHILSKRDIVRETINQDEIGKYFFDKSKQAALAAGFRKNKYGDYIIERHQYQRELIPTIDDTEVADEREEIMLRKLNWIDRTN